MSDNPQYKLEVKDGQPGAVWVVLTRHIVDKVSVDKNKRIF